MRRFFRYGQNFGGGNLASSLVLERFLNILESATEIHSSNGFNVDGVIVSTNFDMNEKYTPRNIFNSLNISGTSNIEFLDCYPQRDEHRTLNRMWNLIGFGGMSEYDIFIPTLMIADNTGIPYLLYNKNVYDFTKEITTTFDKDDHGFSVVPVNESSYNEMRQTINVGNLYELYSGIDKFTIFDISETRKSDQGYKYREYLREILKNMRFNEKILDISDKFILTPLINVESDMTDGVELKLSIGKAVVVEDFNDKLTLKDYDESDSVLVIYDKGYSGIKYNVVRHQLPIIDYNGCVHECSIELGNDIVPNGESYKFVRKIASRKGLEYADTVGNIPVYEGETFIPVSFYEGYDLIKKNLDESISSYAKMAKSTELIDYTLSRLFTKGESFVPADYTKVPMIINKLKTAVKESYSPKAVVETVKKSLREVMDDVYKSGDYRKLAICKNIFDSIR